MNDAGPGPGQGLVAGHWDPSVLRPSVHRAQSAECGADGEIFTR